MNIDDQKREKVIDVTARRPVREMIRAETSRKHLMKTRKITIMNDTRKNFDIIRGETVTQKRHPFEKLDHNFK